MKKLAIFALLVLWMHSTYAQSCLPEGITFTTQSQIDNFPSQHPDCIHIDSCVGIYGDDITNLDSLIQLESIGSWLDIMYTDSLVSIEGLSNISHIDGEIKIMYNEMLTSLSGLDNLDSTNESFFISHNDALINIENLDGLTTVNNLIITGNDLLQSLDGIGNLSTVKGDLRIGGQSLISLTNFNHLDYINGDLFITNVDSLVNLSGLEQVDSMGGGFRLLYALSLLNIDAVENVEKINGGIELLHNPSLTNVNGFQNLQSIGGGVIIQGCSSLNTLGGLDNLKSIGGILVIIDNAFLNSLSGIGNIDSESITKLEIFLNNQLSYCEVNSVCGFIASPNGTIDIHNNAPGCNTQTEVEEACTTIGINERLSAIQLTTYPNPFTTSSTIQYELTQQSHIELTIYNHLGEAVKEAVSAFKLPGVHTYVWSAESLPEGLYYAVLRSGDGVSVVKLIKQ